MPGRVHTDILFVGACSAAPAGFQLEGRHAPSQVAIGKMFTHLNIIAIYMDLL